MLKTAKGKEKEDLEQALRDIEKLERMTWERRKKAAQAGRQSPQEAPSPDDGLAQDVEMQEAPTLTSSSKHDTRTSDEMELDPSHGPAERPSIPQVPGELRQSLTALYSLMTSTARLEAGVPTPQDTFKRTAPERAAREAAASPPLRRTFDALRSEIQGDCTKDAVASFDRGLDQEDSLDSFVGMRRGRIPPPRPGPTSIPDSTTDCTHILRENVGGAHMNLAAPPSPPSAVSLSPILRAPAPSSSRQFIIATTVLAQHALVRHIEMLDPAAQFIERDFAQYASSAATASLSHEADIILSPSTGLVLTTLPHLRQMALPGSGKLPPLRARLVDVAPRYGRMVLLVAAGQPNGMTSPTPADAEALAGLQGFLHSMAAAEMDTTFQVVLALNGLEEMARWIVLLMAKHGRDLGVRASESEAEETPWELWLRRAGLNALAAMAVLAPPVDRADHDGQPSEEDASAANFQRFLKMDHRPRLSAFGDLVDPASLTRLAPMLDRTFC